MKPDSKSMVHHWADCQDCDWDTGGRNCIGLASQHAASTGHHILCETGHHYEWNSGGGG